MMKNFMTNLKIVGEVLWIGYKRSALISMFLFAVFAISIYADAETVNMLKDTDMWFKTLALMGISLFIGSFCGSVTSIDPDIH